MVDLTQLSRDEKIVGGLLALFFVPALFVGTAQMAGINTFSLAGSTLCVDGVSDVTLDTSAMDFEDGEAWKISTSTGCNDEILGGGGEVEKEDIKDGDIEAESGFKAGMTDFEAWFYNDIDYSEQESDAVYRIETKAFECDDGIALNCNSNDRNEVEEWQSSTDYDYYTHTSEWSSSLQNNVIYASRAEKIGQIHDFSPDQGSTFESELTLCADGDCESEQISQDKETVTLGSGDQQARVRHTGSLIGELRGINYDGVKPIENNDGDIVLGAEENIEDYRSEADGVQECLEKRTGGILAIEEEGDHQAAADECSVTNDASNTVTDQRQIIEDSLSIDGEVQVEDGEVRTVADDPNVVERVGLEWTINSDWIGVYENVPNPEISNTEDFEIEENSDRTIELPVKNNGKGGYIRTSAECDSPISGDSDRVRIGEGQTERVSLDIDASTGDGGEYTCDVEATPTDQSSETSSDTASFTVKLVEEYSTDPDDGEDGENGGDVVTPPENDSPPYGIIGLFTAAILAIIGFYNRNKIREVFNR